jgi:transcription elongation GreA/GreB family factor
VNSGRMSKRAIVKKIIVKLTEEMALSMKAARTAREEATGEGSKAEHKYDTRGLEAAYLAGGQARQAAETEKAIAQYETLALRKFGAKDPIDLTALVELESDGERIFHFLGPVSGGLELTHDGRQILVITPQAPLGQNLIGKKQGDRLKMKLGGLPVEYRVVSVS